MELLEQLDAAAKAVCTQRELTRVRGILTQQIAEQAVLEERAAREATDVRKLEGWSVEWLTTVASLSASDRIATERREALEAGFAAMAHGRTVGVVEAVERDLAQQLDPTAPIALERELVQLEWQGLHLARAAHGYLRCRVRCGFLQRMWMRCDAAQAALGQLEAATSAPERGELLGTVALAGLGVDLGALAAELSRLEAEITTADAELEHARAALESLGPQDAASTPEWLPALWRLHGVRVAWWEAYQQQRAADLESKARQRAAKKERGEADAVDDGWVLRWSAILAGDLAGAKRKERSEAEEAVRAAMLARERAERAGERLLELEVQLEAWSGVEERLLEVRAVEGIALLSRQLGAQLARVREQVRYIELGLAVNRWNESDILWGEALSQQRALTKHIQEIEGLNQLGKTLGIQPVSDGLARGMLKALEDRPIADDTPDVETPRYYDLRKRFSERLAQRRVDLEGLWEATEAGVVAALQGMHEALKRAGP